MIGAAACAAAAPSLAAPALAPASSSVVGGVQVQAHRGGSFIAGKATYAENTLPAFRAAAKRGDVLELDVGVTADGVPVVLHDGTLDRTTACTGELRAKTLAQLAACPDDILGSPGGALGGKRTSRTTPIPTLVSVLKLAEKTGATVSAELKDFDADGSRVARALDVLGANRLPKGRLIIQSFLPPNLDAAKRRLPGVLTSRLATKGFQDDALTAAIKAKDTYVSPAWPVSAAFVRRAHRSRVKVAAYTLDRASQIRAARRAGVDAVITDDPVMARRTLAKR